MRQMFKQTVVLFVLLAALVVFASCGRTEDSIPEVEETTIPDVVIAEEIPLAAAGAVSVTPDYGFTGTWQFIADDGHIEFNLDGTGFSTDGDWREDFTWERTTDGLLVLIHPPYGHMELEITLFEYSASNSVLILNDVRRGRRDILMRVR